MAERDVINELGLPQEVSFSVGEDGIHIVSIFGDAWCKDEWDEELGDYRENPALYGRALPGTVAELCDLCVKVARAEEE